MEEIPLQSFCLAGAFFSVVLFSVQTWPFGHRLQKMIERNNPKKSTAEIQAIKNQLANRITGVVHNIIQIPFAMYVLMDMEINGDHLYGANATSTGCLIITVGYFIVDAVICTWYFKEEGPLFFFHAIASLTLYVYGCISGFLHYYGVAFLMWEMSTPFVHARWLMHVLHMHDKQIYFINGLLMLSTFFIVRCIYGLYLSFDFWSTSEVELRQLRPDGLSAAVIWLYRLTNIGLNSLNFFWMTKMIQRASAFLKKRKA